MGGTSALRFAPERILPGLMLPVLRADEYCTAGGPALADASAFEARPAVALTRHALARVPARMAVLL
jgi:hypothetical protein